MDRFRARLCTGALAAALAVLFGTTDARAQTLPPLRVSTTPIDLGAEVLYANDQGFFKDAGLDVEITVLANGAAVAASVASGAEDIGEANLVSLASAHGNGIPFVVIAPAGNYTSKAPTTVMITAKSSTLKSAKDLDGKTIGVVAVKDITQIGASSWIDKTGGNLASVKFIEIPQSAMCNAIASGRVDAGVVSEPFLSIALANGCRVLVACHDSIASDFLVGAWFANTAWANDHADQVQRFRAVIARTARWANAHHAESQRILEKIHQGVDSRRYDARAVPGHARRGADATADQRGGTLRRDQSRFPCQRLAPGALNPHS